MKKSRNNTRSRRYLAWLIALIVFSVMGVVGIQLYWLHNAYNLKRDKFDRNVAEAITRVSEHLENLESMRFLKQSFGMRPFFTTRLGSHFGVSPFSDTISVPKEDNHLKLSMHLGDDTLMVYDSQEEKVALTAFHSKDSVHSEVLMESGTDEIMRKAMQLDQLLRKIVLHELRRKKFGQLIDQGTLDSLIRFELRSYGLDVPYEFAVLVSGEPRMKSSGWKKSQVQHEAMLFPNSFFEGPMLNISFPERRSYIFRSMWLMLGGSLLFTGAIVFLFYKAVHFSLRQKQINEIKTDFVNNMTHEFKTPIATISLAIDAMNSPAVRQDPEKIARYSEMIRQENKRMDLQVERVLQMALLDKQKLNLSLTKVLVQDLIENCVQHIALQIEERSGKVRRFFNDGGKFIFADRHHLSGVIINLLDNAIKYSTGEPIITINTDVSVKYFIISISDQGMGMSKEEQRNIFNRFHRVSMGDIHDIKGHGLGLSYVKGVVEAHKGRVEVRSEKGKGSTFKVFLPLS